MTKTKQINLKIPNSFLIVLERYVDEYGFRNIQDLALESMREKIFEKSNYDETFSEEEIELIDKVIRKSLERDQLYSEEELLKDLSKWVIE